MTPTLPPPLPAETTAEQNLRLVSELKARYPERVRALLARARAKLEAERTPR